MVGSFVNVCIYRIPRGESIIRPQSHCPRCGRAIPWFWNVPVLSYLLLHGTCRYCHGSISPRYPIIELLGGCFAVSIAHGAGWIWESLLYFAIVCGLLAIAVIDWSHMIIPREIIGVLVPAAVLLAVRSNDITLGASLGGVLLGGGFLAVISLLYRIARKREGMGGGDVFLGAVLGIVIGWRMPLLLLFSAGSALLYGLYLIYRTGKDRQAPVPYGSFLAVWGIAFLYVDIYF